MIFPWDLFGALLVMAVFFVPVWLILAGIILGCARLWLIAGAWIDDNPETRVNPITDWVARKRGYEPSLYSFGRYRKGDKVTDGCFEFVIWPAPFFVVLVVALQFYPILIAVGLLVLAAHGARAHRRFRKLYNKHAADPNAHLPQQGRGQQ